MSTSINPDIYIVSAEVEVLPTSKVYEGEGRMFGSGLCLCWAGGEQDAIGTVKESLTQNGIKLIRVKSVTTYIEAECCTQEVVKWANLAYETEEVVYGHFLGHHESSLVGATK